MRMILTPKLSIFFIVSLFALSLRNAYAATTWNSPACKVLSRKVHTKAWAPFAEKFAKGTEVVALGASKMGKNPAVIFKFKGTPPPSLQGLEFKAQSKCFAGDIPAPQVAPQNSLALDDSSELIPSNGGDESLDVDEPEVSSGSSSKNRSWMLRGIYLTKEDLFFEKTTSKLDRVISTHYGLGVGAAFKGQSGKKQGGMYLGLVYLTGNGESSKSTNIAYKSSSSAYGLEMEPYFLYNLGRKFAVGPAFNLMITQGSWKNATNGSIDTTLNLTTTFNLKMEMQLKKYIIGSRLGVGIRPSIWAATLDFGAPF